MRRAERVAYISEKLNELYPEPPIPLHHKNTFTLLVAVLLSAQCTDERVNMVTPLCSNGPTIPGIWPGFPSRKS